MRIVFFTRQGFQSNELFLYMFARTAAQFNDVHIVAVSTRTTPTKALPRLWKRYRKKIQRLGFATALEIISSAPLQSFLAGLDYKAVQRMLRNLPRPSVKFDMERVVPVRTVNGSDAVQAIDRLKPDIIIQAGAGILQPQIFTRARLGTLNLHHGIAPLIRGMNSIYWALWERRPDWLGATVHWIDEGIDTGDVLAYAPVQPLFLGEGYPSLYVRATRSGVDRLLEALDRLALGERWTIAPPANTNVYRSTISGWKLLVLQVSLAITRLCHSAIVRTAQQGPMDKVPHSDEPLSPKNASTDV